MARRSKRGRPLNGVLILNKSAGMTSNRALQICKRLFDAQKAGHTGALDPLATGVLPICFGEATKFSQYLLNADKTYRVRARFGVTTKTLDSEGDVVAEKDTTELSRSAIEAVLPAYRGEIQQIPPMYSALKVDGKALYTLAREGKEIDRKPRDVTIYRLELTEFSPGPEAEAVFEVECSKGTYIRSLVADIGDALGLGAHVAELHRTVAGPFTESQTVTLETLEFERGDGAAESLDHYLLPEYSPVASLSAVELDAATAEFFIQGQAVIVSQVYRFGAEGDIVRVFVEDGQFLGVAEVSDDARILPRRLIANHS